MKATINAALRIYNGYAGVKHEARIEGDLLLFITAEDGEYISKGQRTAEFYLNGFHDAQCVDAISDEHTMFFCICHEHECTFTELFKNSGKLFNSNTNPF